MQLFPDVLLSNAYLILRPFFKPLVPEDSPDVLDPNNWAVGKLYFILGLSLVEKPMGLRDRLG